MKALVSLLFALTMLGATQPQRTTRSHLKVKSDAYRQADTLHRPVNDTLTGVTGLITVAGYDKPLRSRRESFFVTNRSGRDAVAIHAVIEYSDMQHRQLHKRAMWIDAAIPDGTTRIVDIASWDKQQSFYYAKGAVPKRVKATPYDVTIAIDTLVVTPLAR